MMRGVVWRWEWCEVIWGGKGTKLCEEKNKQKPQKWIIKKYCEYIF